MLNEPKTTAELMSCDEREFVSYKSVTDDKGYTVRTPVMSKLSLTPISGDSIFVAWDDDGVGWKPVRHKGTWYKQRHMF